MMDQSKRKKIIYAVIAFVAIIILSIIGFIVSHKNSDLPPVDSTPTQTSDNKGTTTPVVDDSNANPTDEVTTSSDGSITYDHFDDLVQADITDARINVVEYYLSEYASTQSTGAITIFALDTSSIKRQEDGDRTIFTFSVKDNAKKAYTVELSYIYAADAFVRIFDKDNNVIQTSPLDQ
jgi:catabolite regulation protein CreA